MWSGRLPASEYRISFVSAKNEPISGVTPSCSGNDIWPSEEIANEINNGTNVSDSNGLLLLKHNSYGVGGSYKKLGPFQWGYSESEEVRCLFKFNGEVIASGELNDFDEPKTFIVSIERIEQ